MKDRQNRYSFFKNTECEFFPCHKTENAEDFNCMFCYCPLYTLGDKCGGSFRFLENGIKDCSNCLIPHSPDGYELITTYFPEIAKLAKKEK